MDQMLARLVAEARRREMDAVEMEVSRLLPLWPKDLGEPVLVYGPDRVFLGLGKNVPVGAMAEIVVPART